MNSPVDELKMCASCSDTGTTEGFNRWTLEPCVVFCDCPKGEAKKEQRRQELQSKNTRAESPDSVETCDYCNARLNAAGECDNDECDIFEYKPTPPVAAEGELIDKLGKWISGLPKDKPYPGKEMADAIVLITESYIALQSRSTPPPVAGGEKAIDVLVQTYNAGYQHGHHDTVESCFTDIGFDDLEFHREVVTDFIAESDLAALQHQGGVVISEEDLGELIEAAEFTVENFTQEIQPIQSPIHEMVRKLTGVVDRAKQSLERKNG